MIEFEDVLSHPDVNVNVNVKPSFRASIRLITGLIRSHSDIVGVKSVAMEIDAMSPDESAKRLNRAGPRGEPGLPGTRCGPRLLGCKHL